MLVWTREIDPDYHDNSDKPMYDYNASAGDREFSITRSTDRGFGFTAVRRRADKPGTVEYLTERWGIQWCRTLKNCKAECERINGRANDERQ